MSDENKKCVMTKKQAEELLKMGEEIRNRESAYFRDLTAKAFLYMKDNVEKEIEAYSKMKGFQKESHDEILRILNSVKEMIANQCDIVFNRENAEAFKENKLTAEMLMSGEFAKYASVFGFNGVL